jgi:hypothetical protein
VSTSVISPSTVPNAEVGSQPAYARTAAPPIPLPAEGDRARTVEHAEVAAHVDAAGSDDGHRKIRAARGRDRPRARGCASDPRRCAAVEVGARKLTLRHLARPFWSETLDQRISNHWERMLISLRDAGIHAANDEQPEALAKRVGIEGMETCATILERVRHGVRVDIDDLATMDAAAGAVYRQARQKAGIAARTASLVRWPLA